jgi:capsular polysaccharide biosynthesis protein
MTPDRSTQTLEEGHAAAGNGRAVVVVHESGGPIVLAAPQPASAAPSLRLILMMVLVGLLAAAGAATEVLRERTTYVSGAILLMDQPSLIITGSEPGPIDKLNELRSKYVALAQTEEILRPAAARIGLPVEVVASSGSASIAAESLIIKTVGRSAVAVRAQAIAQTLGQQLVAYLQAEQNAEHVPPGQQIRLRIISNAPPGVRESPTAKRAETVGSFAAVAGAAVVYVIAQLFGRRRPRD